MANKNKYPFLHSGEENLFSEDILEQAVMMTFQKKKLPLKSDIPFKMFLTAKTEAAHKCLLNVLSAFTGKIVTNAIVTNPEILPVFIRGKMSRMDIKCEFDGGQMADIELQLTSAGDDQKLRALYYVSRLYSSSLKEGELYKSARSVYQIFLTDFDPFEDGKFYHRAMLRLDDGSEFSDRMQVIFFNLKVPGYKSLYDVPDNLKRAAFWCKFISGADNMEETLENIMDFVKSIGITDEMLNAKSAYSNIEVSAEERAWAYYLSYHRAEADYNNGLRLSEEKGFTNGITQGKSDSKISTARNLLAMKILTNEQIAQAVELPVEKISEISACQQQK